MENRDINCDVCGCVINTEESYKHDDLDYCESCHEGMMV